MDYFKIFTIIFMIIITYLLCNIYSDKIKERFVETEQSIGGVDDQNSINTLAQIAKQLIAGGATVPGNMTVKGEIKAEGAISTAGAITTAGALTTAGAITTAGIIANGRNILAELDNHIKQINELSTTTIKNNETINLRHTKGFLPGNGAVAWTANGSGDSVWVHNWNDHLRTGAGENSFISQFRIQKNNR